MRFEQAGPSTWHVVDEVAGTTQGTLEWDAGQGGLVFRPWRGTAYTVKQLPQLFDGAERLAIKHAHCGQLALHNYPPTGTKCSVCKEPQHQTQGGPVCVNGHGGAAPL